MSEDMKTPTPWQQIAEHVYAPGENGANICTMSDPRASGMVGFTKLSIGSKDINEAFANAAFIVLAVNAHDQLVAALKKAEQLAEIATDWNLDEVEIDGEMVRTSELADEFRAALSSASPNKENTL